MLCRNALSRSRTERRGKGLGLAGVLNVCVGLVGTFDVCVGLANDGRGCERLLLRAAPCTSWRYAKAHHSVPAY